MRTFEITLAFYLILVGLAILVTWTILLAHNQVPNIERDLFSMIFHWSSELFLSLLSISIGIGLLKYSEQARKVLFFDLGMAVCSTFNASYYYSLFEPNAPMATMLGIFTLMSVFFFVVGLNSYRFSSIARHMFYKFGLFALGLFIYLAVNIAGEYGQKGVWSFFIVLIFLIIVGLSILLRLVRLTQQYTVLQSIEPE